MKIKELIKKGNVFIYPTDTIYGIGCDATNSKAVSRIRRIKKRDNKPFSVVAPSKKWIKDNCYISKDAEKWIRKLPGKYTLILRLKNRKCVVPSVAKNTLGVRIPKHWISKASKKPIVTTSVNIAGEPIMTSLKSLNTKIKNSVDFIIYEGVKKGKPSKIVNLTGKKAVIVKR